MHLIRSVFASLSLWLMAASALAQSPATDRDPRQQDIDLGALIEADLSQRNSLDDEDLDFQRMNALRPRGSNVHAQMRDAQNREMLELSQSGACDNPATPELEICPSNSSEYSFGSVVVPRHAAPFQAQIVYSDWAVQQPAFIRSRPNLQLWEKRHICGGTLIAPDWVVTAAHCLKSPSASVYGVRLDVGNIAEDVAPVLPVKDYVIHPCYNDRTHHNDIALLKLDISGVDLALEPLPFIHYATAGRASGSDIYRARLFDEQTASLILGDTKPAFLDLRTGRIRMLPGDLELARNHLSGPGYFLYWSGQRYWLHDDNSGTPKAGTFDQVITAIDYDPDTGALLIAGQDRTLVLQRGPRRSPYSQSFDSYIQSVELLGDDRVRVELTGMRQEIWDMRRNRRLAETPATLRASDIDYRGFAGEPHTVWQLVTGVEVIGETVFTDRQRTIRNREGEISITRHNTGEVKTVGQTGLSNPKLAVSPNGRYLVAYGSSDDLPAGQGAGEVWDIRRSRIIATFSGPIGLTDSTPQFSADGKSFVMWDVEGITEVRQTRTGDRLHQFNHSIPVNTGRLKADDKMIVRTDFGTAELWDIKRGEAVARNYHGAHLSGVDLIGKTFLTWSGSGRVRVWDAETGAQRIHAIVSEDGTVKHSEIDGRGAGLARVSLIDLSETRPETELTEALTAFGWGKVTKPSGAPPSASLRMLGISAIDWSDCLQRMASAGGSLAQSLIDPQGFCAIATGRKTCAGDSGGPVVADNKLVGLVSRGSGVCKDDGRPTTFVTLSHYRGWIQNHVCLSQQSSAPAAQSDSPSDLSMPKFCKGWIPPASPRDPVCARR